MRYVALIVLAACSAAPAPTPVAPRAPTPATKPASEVIGALLSDNVRGRVELDGAPVTYFGIAYVENFTGVLPPRSRFAIHSADGTFTAQIPWGRWDLIIAAPGAARRIIPGVDVGAKLDLGTISLRPGHTVTGIVKDEVGQPVPGAHVEFIARTPFEKVDELGALLYGNISTRTDAGGHYTIRGASRELLGTGRGASLVATAPDRGSLPVDVPDADANVDLRVIPTGAIAVTVTGSTPTVVTASAHGAVLFAKPHDGTWRFERVPAGTYKIVVHDTRLHPRAHQTVTVQPDAVESATLAMPALSPVEVAITSTKTSCNEIQLRDLENEEVAIAPCVARVATFPAIEPGGYFACIDKHECSPLRVEDSPARQKLDVPR